MKCSHCSNELKPVVAVDIDGTLADYHNAFRRFCAMYYRTTMPSHPWDGNGEFEEYLGLSKTEYRAAKLAYRQGGFKRWAPLLPGAVEFCGAVRGVGAELWVATSRPWQRLDNIDPDTRFWLERAPIVVDGLLYGEDKYDQLVHAVEADRIVAVVDDLPDQFMAASHLSLPFMMRKNDHNLWLQGAVEPYGDLYEFRKQVIDRIDGWFRASR